MSNILAEDGKRNSSGEYGSYDGWPNQERAFSILLSYIKEQKFAMAGFPLIFFPVDLTIAAEKDEFAFTIQVPVKPL